MKRLSGGWVTVRVPTVLTSCKVVAAIAVLSVGAGTFGPPELRAWGILTGVLAAGMCIKAAIHAGVEAIKEHLTKYVYMVFEDGFRGGVEQGREMEAAKNFLASLEAKR